MDFGIIGIGFRNMTISEGTFHVPALRLHLAQIKIGQGEVGFEAIGSSMSGDGLVQFAGLASMLPMPLWAAAEFGSSWAARTICGQCFCDPSLFARHIAQIAVGPGKFAASANHLPVRGDGVVRSILDQNILQDHCGHRRSPA